MGRSVMRPAGNRQATRSQAVTSIKALCHRCRGPQPHHHLLQQLAQFHYSVGQQLAQLAAQQAIQAQSYGNLYAGGSPYANAGQFIPGQQFIPGITMH